MNIPEPISPSVRLMETAGYATYFCLQKYGKCRNHNQACFAPLTRQGLDNDSYICRYNQEAELSRFPYSGLPVSITLEWRFCRNGISNTYFSLIPHKKYVKYPQYNTLFTLVWRRREALAVGLYSKLFHPGTTNYNHGVKDVKEMELLVL